MAWWREIQRSRRRTKSRKIVNPSTVGTSKQGSYSRHNPALSYMHWHMGTHHFLASECQAVFAGCRAPVKHIRHRARLVHVTAGANRSSNRTQWAAQDNALHIEQLNHSPAPVDQPSLADPAARVDATAAALRDTFADIDALVAHNLRRVQRAFRAARVGPHYFAGSTGYGHGDLGRAALDEVLLAIAPSAQ